jgi:hypothetical protein
VRLGPASTCSTSLPILKEPSTKESVKQDVGTLFTRAEEVSTRYESNNKKLTNLSDHKTLKVRIKVGSDNLSTQKNAAIYSGLGLDVSPSSSLNDSPSESEGMSREPQDIPFESPSSILQVKHLLVIFLSLIFLSICAQEKLESSCLYLCLSRL